MTDAQYEAVLKTIMHHAVVGPGRAGRTLDALTDAGFVVLHRDDVTEDHAWQKGHFGTGPPSHRRLVTKWEEI